MKNRPPKKILLLCDLFPPAFGPRMGYLVKYLATLGWESTVITEKVHDKTYSFIADETNTHYVDFYKQPRLRKFKWPFVFLANLFFDHKERKFCRVAIEQTRRETFDVILCSSYRTFPLQAALRVAKKTGLPLVADIRDIIEQYPGNEFFTTYFPPVPLFKDLFVRLFKKKSIHRRNAVLRASDHVVTVSDWHQRVLRRHNPNTSLIYNGFDPELFYPAPTRNEQFTITYTGRLLSLEMQDPDLLFRAVRQLTLENVISPRWCRLVWYVDAHSATQLEKIATAYGLDESMDFNGYVRAEKVPAILNGSSILLLLTNKAGAGGPRGIMGTKAFEYLAVQKPILCVRSDEDCLAHLIRETNAGIASKDQQEVCDFIRFQVGQWKKDGVTQARTQAERLRLYSRKEQARQFIRIFEQVLKKKHG